MGREPDRSNFPKGFFAPFEDNRRQTKIGGLTAAMVLVSFERRRHSKRKEIKSMDLKLTGLEAAAVMNALQAYVKELEKAGDEKGILIEKQAVKSLINRLEDMPSGEVP